MERLTKLEEAYPELYRELTPLVKSSGFKPSLWVSSSHRGVNAFTTKSGRRIVFSRELLEKAPDKEVLNAILAHELSHVKDAHSSTRFTLLLIAIPMLAAAFITTSQLVVKIPAAFALFVICPIILLLHFAKERRSEYRADNYAAELLGGHRPVMRALRWVEAETRPFQTSRFHSLSGGLTHPPVESRVMSLEKHRR